MANDFGALTDHFSLATSDLILVDSSNSPMPQSRADANDENGDIAASTYYGNSSGTFSEASCTYALKSGSLNLNTLKLGELEAGVVVETINLTTSNGAWPQIVVSGKLGMTAITAPTGKRNTATLPSITLNGTKQAQALSFTVGEGCKLVGSSLTASCELANQVDGLGEPVAWGLSFNSPAAVSAEFVRVTAQPSWTVSGSLVETQEPTTVEPNAAYHTSTAAGEIPITRGTAG